jgi:hypothetical protein
MWKLQGDVGKDGRGQRSSGSRRSGCDERPRAGRFCKGGVMKGICTRVRQTTTPVRDIQTSYTRICFTQTASPDYLPRLITSLTSTPRARLIGSSSSIGPLRRLNYLPANTDYLADILPSRESYRGRFAPRQTPRQLRTIIVRLSTHCRRRTDVQRTDCLPRVNCQAMNATCSENDYRIDMFANFYRHYVCAGACLRCCMCVSVMYVKL